MVNIQAVRGDEGRLLDSDMPRRAVQHAMTRGFPNGETYRLEIIGHYVVSKVATREQTQGTETSKYLKEK